MSWNPLLKVKLPEANLAEEEQVAQFKKQETFLKALGEPTKFTPDVGLLESRMRWLLFVPDECMKAHHDHARLGAHAKHVSEAVTDDTFTLWKQRNGKSTTAIPMRIQYGKETFHTSSSTAIRYPIRGELYFVNASTLIKLDRHRENGVRFQRERVKVKRPFTQIQLKKVPLGGVSPKGKPLGEYIREETRVLGDPLNVWMYVGLTEYWEQYLDGGYTFALTRRFKPHNPLLSTYYYFSPEEYER